MSGQFPAVLLLGMRKGSLKVLAEDIAIPCTHRGGFGCGPDCNFAQRSPHKQQEKRYTRTQSAPDSIHLGELWLKPEF
jgi:hypothetical protein